MMLTGEMRNKFDKYQSLSGLKFSRVPFFALMLFVGTSAFSQLKEIKLNDLREKKLVYHWVSRTSPTRAELADRYGFQIVHKGDVLTSQIRKHNKRVVRQINRVYGRHWFEKNKALFK